MQKEKKSARYVLFVLGDRECILIHEFYVADLSTTLELHMLARKNLLSLSVAFLLGGAGLAQAGIVTSGDYNVTNTTNGDVITLGDPNVGELEIDGGSQLSAYELNAGYSNDESRISVSGNGSALSITRDMTLAVSNDGAAAMTLSNGAQVSIGGDLEMTTYASNSGTASAGVTVSSGSQLDVADTVEMASGEQSMSLLSVDGGATVNTESLYTAGGEEAMAILQVTDGGVLNVGSYAELAAGDSSSTRMVIHGSGSEVIATDYLYTTYGENATGILQIFNGGKLTTGGLFDADSSGSNTYIAVDGAGSVLNAADDFQVGYYDDGALAITNGGSVVSGYTQIGDVDDLEYQATLSGAGSSWTATDGFYLGGSGTEDTIVTVDVSDGALLDVSGGLNIEGTGTDTLKIAGGTVLADELTMTNDAVLNIVISDTLHQLDITNAATLTGTLTVELDAGTTVSAGDTFSMMSWGSLSGTFDTLDLASLDAGLAWDTSSLYTDGTLSVMSDSSGNVPVPAPLWLVALGAPALMRLRRKV